MVTDDGIDISGLGAPDPSDKAGDNNDGNQGKQGGTNPPADEAAKKAAEDKAKAEAEAKAKEEADKKAKEEADKKGAQGGDEGPKAVELDGVQYQLDKDGNAIKDGKVFKTKAELDAIEAEGEEAPLVDVIINRLGVELKDDKGQPKKYEDTEEGLVTATLDAAKVFAVKEYEKLIKSDPEFEEFVEYKKNGGTLNDFIQKKTNSWGSFKLDENNEAQLMNVIIEDLLSAGYEEAQAKQTAELYKDSKRLKEFGKAAYSRLVEAEKKEEENRVKQFEADQKKLQEDTVNHWNSVKETITAGDIDGIVIPEADKEAFYQYLSVAVDDKGNSKRNLERRQLPLKRLLQLDYYMFKGFNLSELVKTAVKTQHVKTLRNRMKDTNQGGVGGGQGIDKNKYQKPADQNITLDAIL